MPSLALSHAGGMTMGIRRLAAGFVWLGALALALVFTNHVGAEEGSSSEIYDVVVYGGTSAGVAAAVQVARLGQSVVLIEPGRHVGGLSAGGLGATDIGNKAAIGGIAREFYRRLGKHYLQDEAWRHQRRAAFGLSYSPTGEPEMWRFEPRVAERAFLRMLEEAQVPVRFGERLDLDNGVRKAGTRIVSVSMESGSVFRGKVFLDATYEGDLMAKAGVSYHVGREANSVYDETLNGVQTRHAKYHQFKVPVDPYVVPGDAASGLLPGIHAGGPGREGDGDHRVQAYCFRMCLTDVAENRIPFPRPEGYDPQRYELGARYIQAGVFDVMNLSKSMPNRKTDTNNKGAFATDNIGMNYAYPDGDYETRERIIEEHKTYQQGLMWFLVNDSRVPVAIRERMSRWGLPKDEFVDNGGWPHQLYVREARRMVSDYVMTQHDCQGCRSVDDAIGLAAYTMDSHHVQRYVKDGRVRNEGDVEVGGFSPYPIAYRSTRPKKQECSNLLVPVCLSASHIAYGSIRMEPVFMVLGESAAAAACQAIEDDVAVQDIDVPRLQRQLRSAGQMLEWRGRKGDKQRK